MIRFYRSEGIYLVNDGFRRFKTTWLNSRTQVLRINLIKPFTWSQDSSQVHTFARFFNNLSCRHEESYEGGLTFFLTIFCPMFALNE